MFCQAEESMRRADQWNLSKKQGETTNPETIKNLIDIWQNCHQQFSESGNSVILLDTTEINPQKMGQFILVETIKAMQKRINKLKSVN